MVRGSAQAASSAGSTSQQQQQQPATMTTPVRSASSGLGLVAQLTPSGPSELPRANSFDSFDDDDEDDEDADSLGGNVVFGNNSSLDFVGNNNDGDYGGDEGGEAAVTGFLDTEEQKENSRPSSPFTGGAVPRLGEIGVSPAEASNAVPQYSPQVSINQTNENGWTLPSPPCKHSFPSQRSLISRL
jgi:hypothetical protein